MAVVLRYKKIDKQCSKIGGLSFRLKEVLQ